MNISNKYIKSRPNTATNTYQIETQGNHNPPPHEYQQQIYQGETKHKKKHKRNTKRTKHKQLDTNQTHDI